MASDLVTQQAAPPSPAPTHPNTQVVPTGMSRAEFRAMGTTISLLLPEKQLYMGTAAVRGLFGKWEQTLSRFLPDSELSYLNRNAGKLVNVSPLLFHVLYEACMAAHKTNGLFDPTLLPQLVQMGYDRTFAEVPAQQPAMQQKPQSGGGWREIRLDQERKRVILPEGVAVDMGGIAKGMAVDAALERLRALNIQIALVNAGGDLAVMGLPEGQEDWPLAITGKDVSWVVPFHHGALATSGIDRRHWQQGSQVRHHIIDPRSGESARSGLWSVTVAADTCQRAEVAAKAAFLLGATQGRAFLADAGLSGLLVQQNGAWTSAGFWPTALMKEMELAA